jgi:hypothetical protein
VVLNGDEPRVPFINKQVPEAENLRLYSSKRQWHGRREVPAVRRRAFRKES